MRIVSFIVPKAIRPFVVHLLLVLSIALAGGMADACTGNKMSSSKPKQSTSAPKSLSTKEIRRGATKGAEVTAIPAKEVKLKGKKISPATIRIFTDTSNPNAYYVRMDNAVDCSCFMTLSATALRANKKLSTDSDKPGFYNKYVGYVRIVLPANSKLSVFGTIKVGSKTVSVTGDTKVKRTG